MKSVMDEYNHFCMDGFNRGLIANSNMNYKVEDSSLNSMKTAVDAVGDCAVGLSSSFEDLRKVFREMSEKANGLEDQRVIPALSSSFGGRLKRADLNLVFKK